MLIKNITTSITCLLLFISISAISLADSEKKNAFELCVEKHGTFNNGVAEACSNIASNELKKEMNRLYAVIYKKISETSMNDAKAFEQSQITWLKYRKSHCSLMINYVSHLMYASCPMNLNATRIDELKELANE